MFVDLQALESVQTSNQVPGSYIQQTTATDTQNDQLNDPCLYCHCCVNLGYLVGLEGFEVSTSTGSMSFLILQ